MTSIDHLLEKLETGDAPGLDTLDPRFSEIGDIAQKRNFESASDQVLELYASSIYDIRLAVYHFYHIFETQQGRGLQSVLEVLIALFEQNWDAWGPSTKKEKVIANALTWFFQNSNDLIDYKDSKNFSGWLFSSSDLAGVSGETLAVPVTTLTRLLQDPVYDRPATLLASLSRRIKEADSIRQKEEAKMSPSPVEQDTLTAEPSPQIALPQLTDNQSNQSNQSNQITLGASTHLFELQRKLQAFELLVSKGEFQKAAVVSTDVVNLIENFDPRLYFPELFAGFFGSFNKAIQDIRPHLEQRDEMTWQSLEQFYRVDLNGFVDG